MVYWDEIHVRYQIEKIAETHEGRKNLLKVMQDIMGDLKCQLFDDALEAGVEDSSRS